MNILIIGEHRHLEECSAKFSSHTFYLEEFHREAERYLDTYEVVFDFLLADEPEEIGIYANHQTTVMVNTAKISLAELQFLSGNKSKSTFLGFNGLPTFINLPLLEAAVVKPADEVLLKALCEKLNTPYLLVDDRVGMVTPRIVAMIINEAYYTVQEGTATREAINMAMKLGTNYPYGPFEWCERIGIRYIYELLEALYEDTKDERYKIAPLLKKEYLLS